MYKYSSNSKNVIMTRDEVRAFDTWAINMLGIPGVVLMENAGRSCAELIIEKLKSVANPRICIFCGTGNNGGDGFVIARHLIKNGFEVTVVISGDPVKIKGDAKINLEVLCGLGQKIERLNPADDNIERQVETFTAGIDMIVDGLFGTGLSGQIKGGYKRLIESINTQKCPVLSVDIPSGLDCDTGLPLGVAVKANYTVTFVAVKKGFTSEDAALYTGDIYVASIGVDVR